MAAPTLLDYAESNWADAVSTSEVTDDLNWNAAGDVIVALGATEDNAVTLGTPTATGLTFAAMSGTPTNTGSSCKAYAWSATGAGDSNSVVTATTDGTSSGRGISAWAWSGSGGLGTPVVNVGAGITVNVTVEQDSSVVMVLADWNATADVTVTSDPVGGTIREASTPGAGGRCTFLVVEWNSQAAGTRAYGVSAWTGTGTVSKIAVEVKGLTASSIPFSPQRAVQTRDTGEAPWLQRDRRNANLVATAADPLVPPLDSAWQADGRYWHLYTDDAWRSWQPQQRRYVDPSLLTPAAFDPTGYGDRYRTAATNVDRRETVSQRPYLSEPGLLSTAALEEVLLGSADDLRRRQAQAATHAERREVAFQPDRQSDPSLLEVVAGDPLLGLTDARRYLTAATHTERRTQPGQWHVSADIDVAAIPPPRMFAAPRAIDETPHFVCGNLRRPTDQSPLTPASSHDPVLSAYLPLLLAELRAATHADRREVAQQRLAFSDIPADADPLLVAAGVGGDAWRRANAGAYYDRRETAHQPRRWTVYFDGGPAGPPLSLSWGAGGVLWHLYNRAAGIVDRVWQPQQRQRLADLELLAIVTAVNATSTTAVTAGRTSSSATSASRTSTSGVTARRTSTSDVSDG